MAAAAGLRSTSSVFLMASTDARVWSGKADADGVGAVVHHHRRRRRLALHDRAGVELDFFGREAGARRHRLIHVEHRRRSADGVLDAVEHVHHAGDLLDRLADLRRPLLQQLRILREQLDHDRLRRAREIADHVLQELDELDVAAWDAALVTFSRTSAITSSTPRSRSRFSFTEKSPVIGLGDGGQAELQAGAPRRALDFGSLAQDSLHVR